MEQNKYIMNIPFQLTIYIYMRKTMLTEMQRCQFPWREFEFKSRVDLVNLTGYNPAPTLIYTNICKHKTTLVLTKVDKNPKEKKNKFGTREIKFLFFFFIYFFFLLVSGSKPILAYASIIKLYVFQMCESGCVN